MSPPREHGHSSRPYTRVEPFSSEDRIGTHAGDDNGHDPIGDDNGDKERLETGGPGLPEGGLRAGAKKAPSENTTDDQDKGGNVPTTAPGNVERSSEPRVVGDGQASAMRHQQEQRQGSRSIKRMSVIRNMPKLAKRLAKQAGQDIAAEINSLSRVRQCGRT